MLNKRAPGGDLVLNGLRVSAELERFVAFDEQRLSELALKAVAKNTRLAYSADWDSFCGWCTALNYVPLPASPDVVARYMRWLIDRPTETVEASYRRSDGREVKRTRTRAAAKTSTVCRHLVSIRKAHLAAEFEDPTTTVHLRTILRGICNERGVRSAKKESFDRERLLVALQGMTPPEREAIAGRERGCARRNTARRLGYLRDRAILLLGWSGAFRRSELVAIDVDHIRREQLGIEIFLPSSKTNQQGNHESVLIGPPPAIGRRASTSGYY